jgi:hypothetical protein
VVFNIRTINKPWRPAADGTMPVQADSRALAPAPERRRDSDATCGVRAHCQWRQLHQSVSEIQRYEGHSTLARRCSLPLLIATRRLWLVQLVPQRLETVGRFQAGPRPDVLARRFVLFFSFHLLSDTDMVCVARRFNSIGPNFMLPVMPIPPVPSAPGTYIGTVGPKKKGPNHYAPLMAHENSHTKSQF